MIEGNLEDISLPGLLQLLAAESNKNYRLRISKGGQRGDVFVCEGHLLVATFGILEGLDALSEFLNWTDGEFIVEKLPSHFKSTIRSNINLNLSEPGCFADQCAFLQESNVGLNTEIVPSRTFGTAEWQEALHVQPLKNEDYAILGWITDGRTMRQAMREYQFDLKKAIGILYRLLITRSVEVVRPTAFSEQNAEHDELVKLATRELAKHTEVPIAKKGVTVEFHATDIGGARARPRTADDTASRLASLAPLTENEEISDQSTLDSTRKKETAEDVENKVREDGGANSKTAIAVKSDTAKSGQPSKVLDLMKDTITESKPAAKDSNLNEAINNEDLEVKDSFKKQLKKNSSSSSSAASAKAPHQTQDLPAIQKDANPSESLIDTLNTGFDELLAKDKLNEAKEPDEPASEKVLNVVAAHPIVKQFDERRTDPLPLVSIDIERLLASTFQLTNIGGLALTNTQLDDLLKQVLLDAERGKTLLLVLTDSNRSESAVLASYRYCLDRGYIEHTDPVMSLTVDLLLGKIELEQYLLQRRRITGDQLRDMVAISNRQGIPLDKLLVAAGYMLPVDMERVRKEKERFCPR